MDLSLARTGKTQRVWGVWTTNVYSEYNQTNRGNEESAMTTPCERTQCRGLCPISMRPTHRKLCPVFQPRVKCLGFAANDRRAHGTETPAGGVVICQLEHVTTPFPPPRAGEKVNRTVLLQSVYPRICRTIAKLSS